MGQIAFYDVDGNQFRRESDILVTPNLAVKKSEDLKSALNILGPEARTL